MDFVVVAELRPVIGSCQFYIRMNKCKYMEVKKVVAVSNKILLKGSKNEDIAAINIDNISIAKDSFSGLQISDSSIQFRVRVEPSKIYGCFKNEMLFEEKYSTILSSRNDYYKPDFKTNEEVIIFCRQCFTAFNQTFKFKRILPLPTSFDTCDFFCHNNLSNNNVELKPEDCLYGLLFVQIKDHSQVSSSDKVVFCSHCQAWLGIREKNVITFWNSSVKFNNFIQDNTSGLSDFIFVIKHVIERDMVANKIILYATLTNNETHYLLLWVMEKSLSLLTNKNANTAEVELKEQKVFKVLYLEETEESSILKTWKNSMSTSRIQVSKQMMTEGLIHLKNMSQNIPEDFREANQMLVSYIMV